MMGLKEIKHQPFGDMVPLFRRKENDIHIKVGLLHGYPHRTHLSETISQFTSKGMRYGERDREKTARKKKNPL